MYFLLLCKKLGDIMKFIYAYDTTTKEKLLDHGYKLMTISLINGKETFVFLNNGKKLNFEEMDIKLTNKLMF